VLDPRQGDEREVSVPNQQRRGLQGKRGGRNRVREHSHQEASPTQRLVVVDAAKRITADALVGSAVALAFVIVAMVVASAVLPETSRPSADRVGRGIVAASAVGIVGFGLLYGYLGSAARLALAAFYTGLTEKGRELRDTVTVRGQASRSPYGTASASTMILGSASLLAAVPCVVLAAEHAGRLDDELHRTEFTRWAVWAGIFLVVTGVCAAGVWGFAVLNRRWAARTGPLLPAGVLGDRGPAARITTRAQRRVERRSWQSLDWSAWTGRVLVSVGAGLVFLGVYLRQPGLYADRSSYSAGTERLIDLGTVTGGILLVLGLAVVAVTGGVTFKRTLDALRRATADTVASAERALARAGTTMLSNAASVALIWWTVGSIVALGWWFSNQVRTSADGDAAAVPLPGPFASGVFLVGWALVGLLLVAARVALEHFGPTLRNRFGYQIPSEPDDREYPNLTLFGQ